MLSVAVTRNPVLETLVSPNERADDLRPENSFSSKDDDSHM